MWARIYHVQVCTDLNTGKKRFRTFEELQFLIEKWDSEIKNSDQVQPTKNSQTVGIELPPSTEGNRGDAVNVTSIIAEPTTPNREGTIIETGLMCPRCGRRECVFNHTYWRIKNKRPNGFLHYYKCIFCGRVFPGKSAKPDLPNNLVSLSGWVPRQYRAMMAATGLKHNEKTIYKAMVKQLATEKNWKQQLEEYVARNGDFPFLDVLGVDKISVQIGKRSGKIPIVVVVDNKSGRPVIYFIEESVNSANKELKRVS